MKHLYFAVTILFVFFSCANHPDSTNKMVDVDSLISCATPLNILYAKEFSATYMAEQDIYFIRIQNETNHNKVFCLFHDTLSYQLPSDVISIQIPLTKTATNSTTHLEFIRLLNEMPSLCGVCNANDVYSDTIYQKIMSKQIIELGNSMQVNKEQLLLAQPQVLFLSDHREEISCHICPMIICQEWKENNALGRAEWIKFFSLFYDKYSMADSIFVEIERKYNTWKNLAYTDQNKPTVFAAGNYGDTWYLTGGKGYMASLYLDANANFCLTDTMVGTVTCGLEWMLTHFQNVDFWMNSPSDNLSELDPRLSSLKSVQTGQVYNFNKRSIKRPHAIISDFYESAVAHPDLVLGDVVSVLHPDLFPDYETIYVNKLK